MNWQVCEFSEEHLPSLLELRRAHHEATEFSTPEYVRWQWQENPAGPAISWVAIDSRSEVVGEYWVIPVHYWIGGRAVLGSIGANALVHPDYRCRGVFTQLGRCCRQTCETRRLAFTLYVPNAASGAGLLKNLGCSHLGSLHLLVFPLDAGRLASRLFRHPLARRSAVFGLRAWSRLLTPREAARTTRSIDLEELGAGDSRMDEFWLQARAKYPCSAVRDRRFQEWRYKSISERRYRLYAAHENGRMCAYLCLRSAQVLGLQALLVIDLLTCFGDAGRGAAGALITRACDIGASEGADLVGYVGRAGTEEYRLLQHHGFRRCPSPLNPHPFRLTFQDHGAPEAPVSLRSWYWTLADYDVL